MKGCEPIWISERLVWTIHRRLLAEHGGVDGGHERELRWNVLAAPREHYAASDGCDKPRLAASYLVSLARSPALFDGNKRTAVIVCETFLELNGCRLNASDDEFLWIMIGVAAGRVSEAEVGEWVRAGLE